ncbi:MAG: DUF1643 domain-containing protein [Sphingomonas fennica]
MTTDLFGEPLLRRDATFSSPGVRKTLSRDWALGPRALVIGCNPSTADHNRDDPTTQWWMAWFEQFGFGGFDAVNLYPFCTSSPAECRLRADAALGGPAWGDRDDLFANLDMVATMAKVAHQVFVCWGAIAWDSDWVEHVVERIQTDVAPWPDLWCWGTTGSGAPKHPLARGKHRIPRNQPPILWRAA